MEYSSLHDLAVKRASIKKQLNANGNEIKDMWNDLFHSKPNASKADKVTQIINTSIAVYEGYKTVRGVMQFFSKKKRRWFF